MKTTFSFWLTSLYLFLSLFLVGCSTTEKVVFKDNVVYVNAEPPSSLYEPVKRIKPPNIETYVQSESQEKEELLFDHIDKLNKQISSLLEDRKSIQAWVIKQRALIKEKERDKK